MNRLHLSSFVVFALSAVGCGGPAAAPPRQEVAGRVLVNNQPLGTGRLRLTPTKETKGPATSAAVQGGFFQIPAEHGVPAGTYRVEVEEVGAVDLNDEENFAKYRGQKVPAQRIPPQFNQRSELLATVEADKPNMLNLYIDFSETP